MRNNTRPGSYLTNEVYDFDFIDQFLISATPVFGFEEKFNDSILDLNGHYDQSRLIKKFEYKDNDETIKNVLIYGDLAINEPIIHSIPSSC